MRESTAAVDMVLGTVGSLCPEVVLEPPVFLRRPAAEPGMRGCWDGERVTVAWHGSSRELRWLPALLAHEYGHQVLQAALERHVPRLARPLSALLSRPTPAASWVPEGSPAAVLLGAWASGPDRHGPHGRGCPEEWYAEGFRLLAGFPLGAADGHEAHPSVAGLLPGGAEWERVGRGEGFRLPPRSALR